MESGPEAIRQKKKNKKERLPLVISTCYLTINLTTKTLEKDLTCYVGGMRTGETSSVSKEGVGGDSVSSQASHYFIV